MHRKIGRLIVATFLSRWWTAMRLDYEARDFAVKQNRSELWAVQSERKCEAAVLADNDIRVRERTTEQRARGPPITGVCFLHSANGKHVHVLPAFERLRAACG